MTSSRYTPRTDKMSDYEFLTDEQSLAVQEAARAAGHDRPILFVTIGFDGEVRIHDEEQPGWTANFVHVYVRGSNIGTVFGRYTVKDNTRLPNSPEPGVYNL